MSSPVSRFYNWLENSKPSYTDHRGSNLHYQCHELVTTSTRNNVQKVAVEFRTHVSSVGEIRRAARFLVAKMTVDSGFHLILHQAHSKDDGKLVIFVNVREALVMQQSSDDSTDELKPRIRNNLVKSPGIAIPVDTAHKDIQTKTEDLRIQIALNQANRDDGRCVDFGNRRDTSQALQNSNSDIMNEMLEPRNKPDKYDYSIAMPMKVHRANRVILISNTKNSYKEKHQAHSRVNERRVVFNNAYTLQEQNDRSTDELTEDLGNKLTKNGPGIAMPVDSEEYVVWKTTSATRKATFNGGEVMLPVIVRSQGVSTDVVTSQPIATEPSRGREIPLDYESPEFTDKIAMSYLTNTNVYERTRLQLAYFRYERSATINLMSYVNNKVFLACNGLPQDDAELERIYYKFCTEKGITTEEVKKDMEATRREMENKLLTQKTVARKNFNDYYTPNRHVAVSGGSGGCDPELCSVM